MHVCFIKCLGKIARFFTQLFVIFVLKNGVCYAEIEEINFIISDKNVSRVPISLFFLLKRLLFAHILGEKVLSKKFGTRKILS